MENQADMDVLFVRNITFILSVFPLTFGVKCGIIRLGLEYFDILEVL